MLPMLAFWMELGSDHDLSLGGVVAKDHFSVSTFRALCHRFVNTHGTRFAAAAQLSYMMDLSLILIVEHSKS